MIICKKRRVLLFVLIMTVLTAGIFWTAEKSKTQDASSEIYAARLPSDFSTYVDVEIAEDGKSLTLYPSENGIYTLYEDYDTMNNDTKELAHLHFILQAAYYESLYFDSLTALYNWPPDISTQIKQIAASNQLYTEAVEQFQITWIFSFSYGLHLQISTI